MEAVAKAEPDGYTLLMGTPGLATNALDVSEPAVRSLRRLAPAASSAACPTRSLCRRSSARDSVRELNRHGQGGSPALNYASSGTGNVAAPRCRLSAFTAGLDMQHIPTRAARQAQTE